MKKNLVKIILAIVVIVLCVLCYNMINSEEIIEIACL